MSAVSQLQVETQLKEYVDPYLEKDLISAGVIKNIDVNGDAVKVDVLLGFASNGYAQSLRESISEKVKAIQGVSSVDVNISQKIVSHSVQQGVKPLPNIKNVIAVASGKGGVGKSTTSVNLGLALAAEGASVGILDGDIYGPSMPRLMGLSGQPDSKDGKSMEPMENYGVQAMSIGFLIEEETPMIWRGPMVTQALEQLLTETNWRELDYLIIDLPPGTGDIQLTLAQKVPVSGAVIVTTPQDIALLDARKGLKMFEKVNVPVLGIVENMSTHICSQCGHEEHIFGSGGGAKMASDYNVDLLGSLPLDIQIREQGDNGKPTVAADPDGAISQAYREIARKVGAKLSLQAKDYSAKFPNIVIENS
ncbi:MAG: iron-sulfur cluster carrier protein ApbC [Gammaproteobacteria bacterium]|nr:iron-sulfur cluster carrier protein ApbC [Gammaproteobacteria bacterium]MDH5730118.1 iron-sulfur cluster carrier protein ApbC [Gammaproteobacteria bacterium]